MPIYDYLCSACGHRTEVIHGIHEDAPRFCPSCGAEGTLRKGISTPAILFKGSGWAKKDRAATRTTASGSSGKAGDKGSDDTKAAGGSTKAAGSDSTTEKPATSSSPAPNAGAD